MGITIGTLSQWRGRKVTKAEVKALTRDEAALIYRRNYWDKVRGDDLPAGLDLVAFDGAVNSGVSRGAKWLQAALEVQPDGKIGPITVSAANLADADDVIHRALDARLTFLRGLRTWATFGRGWQRRVDEVRATALRMAKPAPKPPAPPPVVTPEAAPGLLAAFFNALRGIFGGRA